MAPPPLPPRRARRRSAAAPAALLEQRRDRREVGAQLLLHRGRAQRRRRVEERQQEDGAAAELVYLGGASDLGDPGRAAGQELGGEVAEGADDASAGSAAPAPTGRARRRRSLPASGSRLSAAGLEDVAMKTSSRESPISSSSLVQQLPGAADEGQALAVLFGAGRLADEHQVGVGVAGPEDGLGAGLVLAGIWCSPRPLCRARPGRSRRSSALAPLTAAPPRRAFCATRLKRSWRAASLLAPPRFVGADLRPARLAPRRRETSTSAAAPGSTAHRGTGRRRGHSGDQLLEAIPALLALELIDRHRGDLVVGGRLLTELDRGAASGVSRKARRRGPRCQDRRALAEALGTGGLISSPRSYRSM